MSAIAEVVPGRSSDTVARSARETLTWWWRSSPAAYTSLFVDGVVAAAGLPGDTAALEELGLIERSGQTLSSDLCIYPFEDLFILCDRPTTPYIDRVFPIFSDESLLLANWVHPKPSDVVVDIGTGSGIAAFIAAKKGAAKVFGSDVTPRAKSYFSMGAFLNGLLPRVEYVQSDVLDQFSDSSVNVVISNPPFVPLPEGMQYFSHSAGGFWGLDIIERLVPNVGRVLKPNGHCLMLALSLGGPSEWLAESIVRASTRENRQYGFEAIYESQMEDLSLFTSLFQQAVGFEGWQTAISKRGLNQLGYFGVHIGAGLDRSLDELRAAKLKSLTWPTGFWDECAGTMTGRLRRYDAARSALSGVAPSQVAKR